MKIAIYIIVYSFLGYILERIINLVAWGIWYDNSVLVGPYQPMYGVGVVLTLYLWWFIKRLRLTRLIQMTVLIVVAALITGMVELISGTLYEALFDEVLWDYRITFDFCRGPYTCWFPTFMFGLLSVFTVKVVHPLIESYLLLIPKGVKLGIVLVFLLDVIYTYYEVLL